jgi:hypothetical protein
MDSRVVERNVEGSRQSYYLNQRNLIIHSNDRNERIWPNANHFEVTIPNPYKNVQSIRLGNIILPKFTESTFSNNNRNLKLTVILNNIDPTILTTTLVKIEIQEGDYTPIELANELQNHLNMKFFWDFNGGNNKFIVTYNPIKKKLLFVLTSPNSSAIPKFYIHCEINEPYSETDSNRQLRVDVFNKVTNWGLGSFLGFKKQKYSSEMATGPILAYHESTKTTLIEANDQYIEPDFELRTDHTENEVYCIELDKINQFDEVTPDKIMDIVFTNNEVDQHTSSFFSEVVQLIGKGPANSGTGVSHFNPPLDSLNKLKFKIRHHDYSLVDFKNRDFTIILQIITLEPDPFKVGRLRKPEFYEH